MADETEANAAVTRDLEPPARALAVGAHPDDVEFGCGATLAKWAAAGSEVHVLVLTDGSKGTWDPKRDPRELIGVRQREQTDAGAVLGAQRVHLLGLVDGELTNGRAEQGTVCAVIRRVQPDVVLGHDPWKRYRLHPDHRAAGDLTISAIVAARDAHYFPDQGLAPHRPRDLLLFEAEERDHVEVVGNFVDRKIDALLCHRSQWRSTMQIDEDAPDVDRQREAFRARIRDRAVEAGQLIDARFGEAFKRITSL